MENNNAAENDEFAHRARVVATLREAGVDPYPRHYDVSHSSHDILLAFSSIQSGDKAESRVRVAGRVMGIRHLGEQTFADLTDHSGNIQLSVKSDLVGRESYALFSETINRGDIVGVSGFPMRTRRGELSVQVLEWQLLTKALRPLPAKQFLTPAGERRGGIADAELKYRQPELRMIMEPEFRHALLKRGAAIRAMRTFLERAGYNEVEVPTLQPVYGGATARPFITSLNALGGVPLYLSISPELYLKRLVVGGYFDGVFTICKNFRNEGIDRTHNPEFTMMECYRAWWDYDDLMRFTEQMWQFIFEEVNGSASVDYEMPGHPLGKQHLNFAAPWRRARMTDLIEEYVGLNVLTMDVVALRQAVAAGKHAAATLAIDEAALHSWGTLVQWLFETNVEGRLIQPTFVTDHPRESTPLCKGHRHDSRLIERFEPFVYGVEIGNAYTELNDPALQRALLTAQAAAAPDEPLQLDEYFCRAIEYGMPPTAGLGVGVDRLVMFLTGASSIRDVIAFPFMRPEAL